MQAKTQIVGVIPARYQAERLPGKPLAEIAGKPMIQWVYEATARARALSRVVVATDDIRIEQAVQRFGGEAILTASTHTSGTERMAEVAERMSGDYFINIQGDEPLMEAATVQAVCERIRQAGTGIASAMTPLKNLEELHSPNVVKVLVDRQGKAIYFSRFPIPYSRIAGDKVDPAQWFCKRHLGIYGYERKTLLQFRNAAKSPMEIAESLEQLRALDAGIPIWMEEVQSVSIGVDTPEDLEKVRQILKTH